MSENNPETGPEDTTQQTARVGSWDEVGRQFQELGQSLAQAFRTAWGNEDNQHRVQEMRTGVESMLREVGRAIDESAKSPEGQKVRAEAARAAESLRAAGEQSFQEVQPQLVNALQQLNNELQKLVEKMEKKQTPGEPPGAEPQE